MLPKASWFEGTRIARGERDALSFGDCTAVPSGDCDAVPSGDCDAVPSGDCTAVPFGMRVTRVIRGGQVVVIRRAAALGACVALVGGCVPANDLESYDEGARVSLDVAATLTPVPEAGPLQPDPTPPEVEDAGPLAAVGNDAASPDAGPGSVCPEACQCERRSGQSFALCLVPVPQALAAERCADAGGALVSIEEESLNDWLAERMDGSAGADFWTGGSDQEDEGVWRWSDDRAYPGQNGFGAPGPFTAWDEGQPNGGRNENCMRAIDGLWRDRPCEDEGAYVCEL
jgi:hypothetical protein